MRIGFLVMLFTSSRISRQSFRIVDIRLCFEWECFWSVMQKSGWLLWSCLRTRGKHQIHALTIRDEPPPIINYHFILFWCDLLSVLLIPQFPAAGWPMVARRSTTKTGFRPWITRQNSEPGEEWNKKQLTATILLYPPPPHLLLNVAGEVKAVKPRLWRGAMVMIHGFDSMWQPD